MKYQLRKKDLHPTEHLASACSHDYQHNIIVKITPPGNLFVIYEYFEFKLQRTK